MEYGASRLFAEVAFGMAIDNNLLDSKNHLDTTSISVHADCARQRPVCSGIKKFFSLIGRFLYNSVLGASSFFALYALILHCGT